MFKIDDRNIEPLAERGTNKLIVKLDKNLFKAAKISPKEAVARMPQAIIPEEPQEEDVIFKIY